MRNLFTMIVVFLNKTYRHCTFCKNQLFSSQRWSQLLTERAQKSFTLFRNHAFCARAYIFKKVQGYGLISFEKQLLSKNQFNLAGFGLLEVIVAVGIWTFLTAAGVSMTTGSLRINSQSTDNDQATLLAVEGLDAARSIKNIGWTTPFLATDCITGCGVATVSGTWGFSGTNDVIGKFTRQVLVTPVNRDGTGNIVSSGGAVDGNTYKVESKVTWQRTPAVTGTVSLVSYLTNFAKSIITTLTGGIIIYGDGTTTPKFRTYDRTANTFSAEGLGPTGTSGMTFMMKTSPIKNEAIVGYVTSSGVLQIMCFDGITWSNEWSVTVGGSGTTRRFDIGFETNSGDSVVLYSTNTTTTNELAFRTKPGTTGCGTGNWSTATSFDPTKTSGTVMWIKLAPNPISSSNLLVAAWSDNSTYPKLSSAIWNGTSLANETSTTLTTATTVATSLEYVSTVSDVDDFDIVYESLSGDVMLVYALGVGANGTNGVRYVTCTGGTATCTWSSVLTPATFSDDATNLDISANPASNEIAFASIGNAGSDLMTGYWSGTAWTNRANVDTSAARPLSGTKLVSTGWLINGATTRYVIEYVDSAGTGISWRTGSGTAATTAQTDFATTPAMGYPKKWIEMISDPINKQYLMATISDVNNDLFAKRLEMTSTGTFTWTNADGAAALETTLPQGIARPFGFTYWKQ